MRTAERRGIVALSIVTVVGLLAVAFTLGAAVAGNHDHHARAGEVPAPADIGFAQDMIQHHQQAVVMSDIALQRGSARIQMLANLIRSNQLMEIGQMQGILHAWRKPQLSEERPMAWMHLSAPTSDGGHRSSSHESPEGRGTDRQGMAGMATQAELERLRTLDARAFDRYFLTLMIRHHRGALPMTEAALAAARTGVVKEIAERIRFDQSTEIVQMNNALSALAP